MSENPRQFADADDVSGVQLEKAAPKTSQFHYGFQYLCRVTATESSSFLERAMGIEPTATHG
jgi:hypothetical protein